MKPLKQILTLLLLTLILAAPLYGKNNNAVSPEEALAALRADYPLITTGTRGDFITRLYGQSFGSGASPEETAERFATQYSYLFGVAPEDLRPESILESRQHSLELVYDKNTGLYKFTLVYFSQYKDGIPVFRSDLRLLVRNEPGYPLVEASNALRNLGDFQVSPALTWIDPAYVQRSFLSGRPDLANWDYPQTVIWAGYDTISAEPAVGVKFSAWNAASTEKYLFIVDPSTDAILYRENEIIEINVTGHVNGNATDSMKSEQCGPEVSTPLPYAKAKIGATSAYADSTGYFNISNGGSSPVTVTSKVEGRYFITHNVAGNDAELSRLVTPPGPVEFLHNAANSETTRAEVNAYLQANVVRDFALKYNPAYPVISTQNDFPVYVNRTDDMICPGNAWYDGYSLNFCLSGSGYPNMAFSAVAHHEYGHHIVECGGSGQGEYGEGMGDVFGSLIMNDPRLGLGFFGDCQRPLRNADNDMQYPCIGEIHDCGQLISGAIWSVRNELQATYPNEYKDIIANLAINTIPLHIGETIGPDIVIDYLIIDDDDDNYYNGTPHSAEICAGFAAHGFDLPLINIVHIFWPYGRPNLIDPRGLTTMPLEIVPVNGTPIFDSIAFYYSTGSEWQTFPLISAGNNIYNITFPAVPCGSTIRYYIKVPTAEYHILVCDPPGAPDKYYSTLSATGLTPIYQDDFSSDRGWEGLGGPAEWAIGPCTGGYGNDSHGGPDPTFDHSSTADNNILGNDLSSGSGGDYNDNIDQSYYATSPVIDCSNQVGVRLSFWRWLGIEQNSYDQAHLEAYDGSSWMTLFVNGSTTLNESTWTQCTYNVSQYADNNPNFRIRFGLGPTDDAWHFCGWNIDDIVIETAICDPLNNGSIAGTVIDSFGVVPDCRILISDSLGHVGYDTTDGYGTYLIGNLAYGDYTVSFVSSLHRDTSVADIPITPLDTTMINISLMRLPTICSYVTGDANGNSSFNGLDVVYSVAYFKGGPQPPFSCECTPGQTWYVAGDVNASCSFNGLDVSYMVSYLKGGPAPFSCADCPPSGLIGPPVPGKNPTPSVEPIETPILEAKCVIKSNN